MRRVIQAILAVGALASFAGAAPLCVNGTMADYVALGSGGCTVSDKLFSNFVYTFTAEGNGVAVQSTDVNVIPDLADPFNPGFHFTSAKWTVFSLVTDTFDSIVDSSILFRAATISGANLMVGNTLTLDAFTQSGPNSIGAVSETINPLGLTFNVVTAGPTVDFKPFAATSFVFVTKDLFVGSQAGTAGSVSITQFSENFLELNATPEPFSFLLMGSGLLGIGLWRRRR